MPGIKVFNNAVGVARFLLYFSNTEYPAPPPPFPFSHLASAPLDQCFEDFISIEKMIAPDWEVTLIPNCVLEHSIQRLSVCVDKVFAFPSSIPLVPPATLSLLEVISLFHYCSINRNDIDCRDNLLRVIGGKKNLATGGST